MSNSTFATYHPIINFGFFCGVIGLGIFLMHPVFLAVGMAASLIYALMLGGKGTLKFFLSFMLPVILLIIVINPIFNSRGDTILFYLGSNYVTLEALAYGMCIAFMLASVIMWFSCYNNIMTSDKFIYLFGRIMPAISLIFSMVMRFVPNYKMQIKKISDAQKCIGRDVSNGTVMQRARHGAKIISVMFTWALENAIDTADSMRSRGYGLKNRNTFSIYRFDRRDAAAGIVMLAAACVVIAGAASGKCSIEFYPNIVMTEMDAFGIAVYAAYFVLCFFPIAIEVKEVLTWRLMQSRI